MQVPLLTGKTYWRERNRMMFRYRCSHRFCEWTTGNSSVSESKAVTPSSSQILSKCIMIDGGTKPYTCKKYGKFLVAWRGTGIFCW